MVQSFVKYLQDLFLAYLNRNKPIDALPYKYVRKGMYIPVPSSEAFSDYPDTEKKKLIAHAKRICEEKKLSKELTDNLVATVWGESGWNPNCVNRQTDDWGLCQFSRRYYLREYKMTDRQAIEQPIRCLEIMAENFKRGRAKDWIAFRSGGYLRWLKKTI